MAEEPSALAMRIAESLQGTDDFTLVDSEIEQLTDYETLVLEKTARKQGWTAEVAPGWGKVIYRRKQAQR